MATETGGQDGRRGWIVAALFATAVVFGATGFFFDRLVREPPDYYAVASPATLPAGAENDLIRQGWQIVIDTPREIGPFAEDPAKRYAGNDLACSNCHLDAGLKRFAAPFVSVWRTYPLIGDDEVMTLAERINACMTRSLNGRPMPEDGDEMRAIAAYMRYVGENNPRGVRVAGMGLMALLPPGEPPSADRGRTIYADNCARCHRAGGEGSRKAPPGVGWAIPPLWGPGSFNAQAGMSKMEIASAFVHANMPRGVNYTDPVLSEQQAWDVAAFIGSNPRPAGPGNATETTTWPVRPSP